MIKVLILYYLSLKPTHGYEIQKFIQASHMDSWTKIQSGSIYYALAKLEKEGLITLVAEVPAGGKMRKIYEITARGREELKDLVREELDRPICDTGSDKFILYPLLAVSNEEEIRRVVQAHIDGLEQKKADLLRWQSIKVNSHTLEVEKLSFEMMLSNLDYQIRWHQALLSQLERCMEDSGEVAELIKSYDFSNSDAVDSYSVTDLEQLKQRTMKNRDV